ncbi:hypothetical protein ACFRCI_09360 [Streptomyces sp. NPDC056638]|uniref:hypothetical protein n=1 Tax=Streptomyces sp. NPDC056638 TaxID=3345887 RepID=UPI0036A8A599
MPVITNATGLILAGIHATDEVPATKMRVQSKAGVAYATLLRVVVPVDAGDVLDISGRARVTNDTSPAYTIGFGYHLWQYDVDNGLGASGEWTQISSLCGDNVDKTRHHMPLLTDTVYTVPANWPVGHRMTIVLRGDAHSTAADGQYLTVDQAYGQLTVRRWAAPTT